MHEKWLDEADGYELYNRKLNFIRDYLSQSSKLNDEELKKVKDTKLKLKSGINHERQCNKILKHKSTDYRNKPRDQLKGPLRLGKSVKLRPDAYTVAYVYQMKRFYVEGYDSEDETATQEI